MAYFPSLSFYFARNISNIFKRIPARKHCTGPEAVNAAMKVKDDQPVQLERNPYSKEKPQCILCKYNIEPDYKNVRLLSQFVSKFTGKVLPRHVTKICSEKHKMITREIKKARATYLMPTSYKIPEFADDPALFDIDDLSKPRRVI